MTSAFLLYDLRRSLLMLALITALVTGLVVLLPGPLQGGDPNWFQLVGILTGILLAGRLLSDTGGSQAYVYSRGLTRRRVFVLRVVLGLALLLAVGVVMWLLITLGLRERWHTQWVSQDYIYYPMSTRYETSIIRPFWVYGGMSFGLMSFYMTWRGLCQASWNGTSAGIYRLMVMEVPVGVVTLSMTMLTATVMVVRSDADDYQVSGDVLTWLPLGLSAAAIMVSWVSSRNLEAV